jgi:hypothetical protein
MVRTLAEGPAAEGLVTVTILPPAGATGPRGEGEYSGAVSSTNIIAASIEAYVEALNKMLDESHWAGAAETAAATKQVRKPTGRRAEYDKERAKPATTDWFDQ